MPGQSEAERRQAGGDVRLEDLQAENEQLRATLERKEAEIAGLRQRLEELERRVGLNSSNSGKPPSSDGPAKPPAQQRTKSQRGRSGKRSGGQRGHKGSTLRQTDSPDRTRPTCRRVAGRARRRWRRPTRRASPCGGRCSTCPRPSLRW